MVRTLTGPAFLLFGLVVCWVGFALWRSTDLNWGSFLDSGWGAIIWLKDEVWRIAQDPIGLIGLLVMAVGVGVLVVGAKRVRILVFGR